MDPIEELCGIMHIDTANLVVRRTSNSTSLCVERGLFAARPRPTGRPGVTHSSAGRRTPANTHTPTLLSIIDAEYARRGVEPETTEPPPPGIAPDPFFAKMV
jgi:hypothetical protein